MTYCKVILLGNMTRDPETRYAQSGTAVVNFCLAVNERYKDKETTTYVDVTMFGKRGEAFAKHHTKGARAFIEGRLRLDQWNDKQTGAKRQKLYVLADSFEFVGEKQQGARGESRASAPAGDAWGGQPAFEDGGGADTPF